MSDEYTSTQPRRSTSGKHRACAKEILELHTLCFSEVKKIDARFARV